jgi:hypothetical protein
MAIDVSEISRLIEKDNISNKEIRLYGAGWIYLALVCFSDGSFRPQ